jgi:hypothetical protein
VKGGRGKWRWVREEIGFSEPFFGVSQKPLVNHLGGYLRISLSPILFGALL